jgi:hypothetical protein
MKIVVFTFASSLLLATGGMGRETIRGMATTPYEETFFNENQRLLPHTNHHGETLFRGGHAYGHGDRMLMSKGDSDKSDNSDKSDKSDKSDESKSDKSRRLSKSDKSDKSDESKSDKSDKSDD